MTLKNFQRMYSSLSNPQYLLPHPTFGLYFTWRLCGVIMQMYCVCVPVCTCCKLVELAHPTSKLPPFHLTPVCYTWNLFANSFNERAYFRINRTEVQDDVTQLWRGHFGEMVLFQVRREVWVVRLKTLRHPAEESDPQGFWKRKRNDNWVEENPCGH